MDNFYYKRDLIDSLSVFAAFGGKDFYDPIYKRNGYSESAGYRVIARGLADYLSPINEEEKCAYWYTLPDELVEAFRAFRDKARWRDLRAAYLHKTGNSIPDLVNIHEGGIHRTLVVETLPHMIATVSGKEWLKDAIQARCNEKQRAIDTAWKRFVRVGYREVIARVRGETHRGNSGQFGKTRLNTFVIAGRCVVTFSRRDSSIAYVADVEDFPGVRSGINIPNTPYMDCIAMIDEVVNKWDINKMKKE